MSATLYVNLAGMPATVGSQMIEIGQLIERHRIGIDRAIWVRLISAVRVEFLSEADMVAFKLVCPFEMMNNADGEALVREKAVEERECGMKVADAELARREREIALQERLITLEAEIEALHLRLEGGGE